MYECDTTHLYPSIELCSICGQKLKEWYRKERTIKALKGPKYLVSHVLTCENRECRSFRVGVVPEEELRLAIKGYTFGLDVISEIGCLRYTEHKTWQEIQHILWEKYQFKISEREIGYLEEAYLALITYVAKNDKAIIEKLRQLKGLILSIDGIQPDQSHEMLYLIREVQTGHVLAGKIIEHSFNKRLHQLVQEVIDIGFPILGVISDKEGYILTTVKDKLEGVPHQLCHYHYLKNLALKIVEQDSRLKRDISSWISHEIRSTLKYVNREDNVPIMPKKAHQVINGYSFVLRTLFKRKAVYPLKPAGLPLYQELLKVRKSLEASLNHQYNYFLENILIVLQNNTSGFEENAKRVETGYRWIYQIASFLGSEENIPEEEKKKRFIELLESFSDCNDKKLGQWLSHIKKISKEWLPNLFRFLTEPLLPKTNNDLEVFNGRIKKVYRRITGRKSSQRFVARFGASVSFLIELLDDLKLHKKICFVPYDDFRYIRDNLIDREVQRKMKHVRQKLDDCLFDLEKQWAFPEELYNNKMLGMVRPSYRCKQDS